MELKSSMSVLVTTLEYLTSMIESEFSSGPLMRVGAKQMLKFETVMRFFCE